MSSYADVAAHNAPPSSQQPVPDPNLLEGAYHPGNSAETTNYPDVDSGKINIVPSTQDLDNIKTESSERNKDAQKSSEREAAHLEKKLKDAEKKAKSAAKKGEKKLEKAYSETSRKAQDYWAKFSSDPATWVPTLGAINAILIVGTGIGIYVNRDEARRWDRRVVSAVTVGVLGLLGGQGYLAAQKAREQKGKK